MKLMTALTGLLLLSSQAHAMNIFSLDCGKTPAEFSSPVRPDTKLEIVLVQSTVDASYGTAHIELSNMQMRAGNNELMGQTIGMQFINPIHFFEAPYLFKGKGDIKSTGQLSVFLDRTATGKYTGNIQFFHNQLKEVLVKSTINCTLRQIQR